MNPFAKLLQYVSKNKDLVGNVAAGSALSAGFGMMAGGPGVGLAYGLGDMVTALPLTAAARKLRPPKTRRVEVSPGKFEAKQEQLLVQMDYDTPDEVWSVPPIEPWLPLYEHRATTRDAREHLLEWRRRHE